MALKTAQIDIPTRVTVLEHGVAELKSNLDSHRIEARAGFTAVQSAIERLSEKGSATAAAAAEAAGNKTNWYMVAGFVVAVVTLIGSMVTVAEWRIGQATAPFQPIPQAVQELRIEIEKERAAYKAVEEYKRFQANR